MGEIIGNFLKDQNKFNRVNMEIKYKIIKRVAKIWKILVLKTKATLL